jgi:hypothetical protein
MLLQEKGSATIFFSKIQITTNINQKKKIVARNMH